MSLARFLSCIPRSLTLKPFVDRRVSIRLVVAIPLIVSALVLGFGIMYLGVFNAFLSEGTTLVAGEGLNHVFDILRDRMIGSVLVAFVVGIFLAYAIILPLREITVGVRTVSSGDLTQKIRINQGDEIGLLSQAFNSMIYSLNQHMLNSMTGGVLTLDMSQRMIAINTTAEMLLECDPGKLMGQHLSILFPPRLNGPFYTVLDAALSGENIPSHEELQVITARAKKVAISLDTAILRKEDDSIIGVVVNFRDLHQLREEMRQTQTVSKLASLGTLAAGLAHEIRNPISSVRGMAELLREDLPAEGQSHQYVSTIIKEMDRLNTSVNTILDFSQPAESTLDCRLHNITDVLESTLLLARHDSTREHISVVRRYTPDIPQICIDADKMQQAILNIILNAFSAMGRSGTLTIATHATDDKDGIKILFKDTGSGIEDEVLMRVFDPFFTTKETGSGLGLSIAHQIIRLHRGTLTVESVPAEGTTFIITLPVAGTVEVLNGAKGLS